VPREIPILPETRKLLRRARRLRSVQGHRRLFLGPDGKPIHTEAAKTALRRAYGAAGVRVAGPWKILRHTFASRMVMRSVPLPVVAKLMGHTTQAITERYAHLSREYVREAMQGKKRPEKQETPGKARNGCQERCQEKAEGVKTGRDGQI
jgi:integrase